MSNDVRPQAPKIPRGTRSLIGLIAAAAVLALAALATAAAIQVRLDHRRTVLGDTTVVARWLRDQTWDDTVVFVIGIALAAVGVLLVLGAILPARRRLVPLDEDHPGTTSGITRAGLRREIAAVAEGVDGIDDAKARVRRRSVKVSARTPLRDHAGLSDAVRDAVRADLDQLALRRQRRVRATVRGGRS